MRSYQVEYRLAPTPGVKTSLPWSCWGSAASLESALKLLKRKTKELAAPDAFQTQIWNCETRQSWSLVGNHLIETTEP